MCDQSMRKLTLSGRQKNDGFLFVKNPPTFFYKKTCLLVSSIYRESLNSSHASVKLTLLILVSCKLVYLLPHISGIMCTSAVRFPALYMHVAKLRKDFCVKWHVFLWTVTFAKYSGVSADL